jgi:hypothetical protein
MKWKEKLAGLNRQYREIELTSKDGSQSMNVYYRRPTELEDDLLRKQMEEEIEAISDGLKTAPEGKESFYDTIHKVFLEGKSENAIGYIVLEGIDEIRNAAKIEAELEDLPADATQEQKDEWLAKFKPIFDRRVEEAKDMWKDTPHEVLATRAAEARVLKISRDRAYEVYRRCLIAQSIYGKDEESGLFERIFEKPEEVPEYLDKDTIDTVAGKVVEEINRFRNVPLK